MHFFIKRKKDPEQKYDWSCVRLRNNQSWHILKAEFRSSNRCTQTIVFWFIFNPPRVFHVDPDDKKKKEKKTR